MFLRYCIGGADIGVWMGGNNEEVCGGAGADVVARHSYASLSVQVYIHYLIT